MTPLMIAIITFGALFFGLAGVMLLLQDLNAASANGSTGRFRLQRLPLDRRAPEPKTFIGRFDRWFLRVIVESGTTWGPVTAVLFMLLLAVLVGGSVFVVSEAPVVALIGALLGMAIAMVILMVIRARRIRTLPRKSPGPCSPRGR